MDILEEIVAHKRQEIAERKHFIPARELYVYVNEAMQQHPSLPSLREALQQSDTGIIAEFKRKSPSKDGSIRMPKSAKWLPPTRKPVPRQ